MVASCLLYEEICIHAKEPSEPLRDAAMQKLVEERTRVTVHLKVGDEIKKYIGRLADWQGKEHRVKVAFAARDEEAGRWLSLAQYEEADKLVWQEQRLVPARREDNRNYTQARKPLAGGEIVKKEPTALYHIEVDQLVEAHVDDKNPGENQHVSFKIGQKTYFVYMAKNMAKNVYMFHVWTSIDNVLREIETFYVGTQWGWSYTARLAVAHAARMSFITPDKEFLALFHAPKKKFSTKKSLQLQWVKAPWSTEASLDSKTLEDRGMDNAVGISTVLELVENMAKSYSPGRKSQALALSDKLKEKDWTVSSAVHANANCKANHRKGMPRITVKVGNEPAGHLYLEDIGGNAACEGNTPVQMPEWKGDSKVTHYYVISEIECP